MAYDDDDKEKKDGDEPSDEAVDELLDEDEDEDEDEEDTPATGEETDGRQWE